MASGYIDDKGKLNPLLQPGNDRNYQAWPVGSSEEGGAPEVMWLEPGAIVDVSNDLAKSGLPMTAGNVRASLARMKDKYPHYYRPSELTPEERVKQGREGWQGAFLRDNQLQFGPAKKKPPQAGLGTGWEALDEITAGTGNAFMGGVHSILGVGEGINFKKALQTETSLKQAKLTNGQEVVSDATQEAAKAGLELPGDPAAILADLISQGKRADSFPTGLGSGYGFYNPNPAAYTPNQEIATNDPRYGEAVRAQNEANQLLEQHNDAQARIKEQQKRREMGMDLFMNPPSSTQHNISYGYGMGVPPKFAPDSRIAGDYSMSQVGEWVKSLTPEQRASMTREQVQAKIDEILIGVATKDTSREASTFARRDEKTRYWSTQSPAMELYNKPGMGIGDVAEKFGNKGALNVSLQQLAGSVPVTATTIAATALASLASGPAAVVVGPAAMGMSTAVLGAGTGFNQAFGVWLAKQGIDLNDLRDPKSKEFAAAQAKINAIASGNPSGFMGQMDEMLSTSVKRGATEGATAIFLNKFGEALTGQVKNTLPKFMRGPGTSGSLLRPAAAIVARPVQTFRDGIYKKILLPRAINGSIDTWWEATEEGLTDIITDIIMGEDVDRKTALSSFMVGGLLGGGSSFLAGRSNIDNPLQILQSVAAEGEAGIDQVAAEIEKNTGMPAARAKAAIKKAGEVLEQFETFAKRYPPTMRGYAWQHFIKGYRGNKADLFSQEQDIRRATIKDKQSALAALQEALEAEKLMAIDPSRVKGSPIIPSLQTSIEQLQQGFDYTKGEGRYYHPLDRTRGE